MRPVVVSAPPRVVSPVPSKVSVGLVVTFPSDIPVVLAPPAVIVEPRSVNVPGVVAEPIVLIDDAPLPIVLVVPVPVARVVLPYEVRVVKAPDAAVVAPICVALIPVAVVLKVDAPVPEVIVSVFVPALIDELDKPESVTAPDVAVRFNAPVV